MMAKQSGLGMACYVDGYDLSGDIGQINNIGAPMKPIDVTSINDYAMERLGGQRDGVIDFTAFMDATVSHPVLSALPTTDGLTMVSVGTVIGSPSACMIGKQLNYDPTRGTAGDLTFKVNSQANGYAMDWGVLLTAGVRTDTAATTGASLDTGGGFTTPAVPSSTTPASNTSNRPATVVISGGTLTNVSVNGVTVGTGDGTYTVPGGGTIAVTYSAAPTWTWTLTSAYGAQAYLEVMGFTGTDATVTLQDSADNATFANIASGSFTQVTAGNQGQRLVLANTATVRRYLRVSTTTVGGFTSMAFAVALTINPVAGVAF
jgi:hypothetical protein